jgi:hypothetical protein
MKTDKGNSVKDAASFYLMGDEAALIVGADF